MVGYQKKPSEATLCHSIGLRTRNQEKDERGIKGIFGFQGEI
jgi:hypothetical protein